MHRWDANCLLSQTSTSASRRLFRHHELFLRQRCASTLPFFHYPFLIINALSPSSPNCLSPADYSYRLPHQRKKMAPHSILSIIPPPIMSPPSLPCIRCFFIYWCSVVTSGQYCNISVFRKGGAISGCPSPSCTSLKQDVPEVAQGLLRWSG